MAKDFLSSQGTLKVVVKKGPQKWRSKVDPKSGSQKRPKKWRPKVDPKSGGQKRTHKVVAKS